MKTLQKMVIRDFLPIFLGALSFFVLILLLVDIFANLWRYLNQDVPVINILHLSLLYIPKCISFSLPISVLFSIAYTLGTYYAQNELIAVFGSGISLLRAVLPLFIMGLFLSVGSFFFEDLLVIPTFKNKTDLTEEYLGHITSLNNDQVTIISHGGEVIYHVGFYNEKMKMITDVTIVQLTDKGSFFRRIESDKAIWNEESNLWDFAKCRIYSLSNEKDIKLDIEENFSNPVFDEPPATFRSIIKKIDELNWNQAWEWISALKRAGLPYKEPLTDLYQRLAFALTPFIVTLLSCGIGGRFKKNVLLMSLLFSLILSVIYYVAQMIGSLLAKLGLITPLMGAWVAFIVFLSVGIYLLKTSKT